MQMLKEPTDNTLEVDMGELRKNAQQPEAARLDREQDVAERPRPDDARFEKYSVAAEQLKKFIDNTPAVDVDNSPNNAQQPEAARLDRESSVATRRRPDDPRLEKYNVAAEQLKFSIENAPAANVGNSLDARQPETARLDREFTDTSAPAGGSLENARRVPNPTPAISQDARRILRVLDDIAWRMEALEALEALARSEALAEAEASAQKPRNGCCANAPVWLLLLFVCLLVLYCFLRHSLARSFCRPSDYLFV
ncbi:hypothetical protein FGG08_007550 [Glutinoglossum americanum]|uniref:Uncharacterized protein n=1 Tax=Glutinoglossum americanum TaxID=1670608 RepID=A0A9P8HZ69_9PEZI|nr:hypothetical protein FGG08_007550 [Glutinoglossum americanum]